MISAPATETVTRVGDRDKYCPFPLRPTASTLRSTLALAWYLFSQGLVHRRGGRAFPLAASPLLKDLCYFVICTPASLATVVRPSCPSRDSTHERRGARCCCRSPPALAYSGVHKEYGSTLRADRDTHGLGVRLCVSERGGFLGSLLRAVKRWLDWGHPMTETREAIWVVPIRPYWDTK